MLLVAPEMRVNCGAGFDVFVHPPDGQIPGWFGGPTSPSWMPHRAIPSEFTAVAAIDGVTGLSVDVAIDAVEIAPGLCTS